MARSFSGSAGSNLRIASNAGVTGSPLTLACQFKRSVTGTAGYLVAITNGAGSPINQIESIFHTAAGLFATESYNNTAYGQSNLASNVTDWVRAAGVHGSVASRVAHASGSAGSVETTSVSGVSMTELSVACLSETDGGYSTATIAAAAGWSAALNDSEIASLNAGFSPRRIRPQSLEFYIPLVREVTEWRKGSTFTTSGGTVADHPRMYGF
jgi:hypothetical protein